jgi:RimJ/RimL family protein N-acetyltransferase
MRAVLDWVERDPRVNVVEAETDAGNAPSRRLLDRLGFTETGPGREAGALQYSRRR